jgi:hypothetical protein
MQELGGPFTWVGMYALFTLISNLKTSFVFIYIFFPMETNHMSIIYDAKNGFDYLKNDMVFKFFSLFLKLKKFMHDTIYLITHNHFPLPHLMPSIKTENSNKYMVKKFNAFVKF